MANVSIGFNGTVRLIALPASTWTPILLSKASARALVLRESITTAAGATNTPVGFLIRCANDATANGFTTIFSRPAASLVQDPGDFPSFQYFNIISQLGQSGEVIGQYDGATPILQVQPLTAAATVLEVWEYA
jgi:hypothetical protein